jgi:pimeloyl-ACP methyl ester carboxylesterase
MRKIPFMLLLPLSLIWGAILPAHAAAPARAPTVPSADGVPIAYEVHGQGSPAVVLVHGWSCDRGYWKEQIDYLAPQYKLVLIDLAGHGESGLGRKDYTMASFGADVAAVVDSLGLEGVVLVGHSMGSDVIVEAAKRLPGKVAGLVWVDEYQSLETPFTAAQVDAFAVKFRKDFRGSTEGFVRGMFAPNADPKLVDRVAKDMASAPPAVGLNALRNTLLNGASIPAALAEIKLPVVAINADRHPTDHESLAKHGVKAFVMPDIGHFVMLEDPLRFNRSLDSVIKSFGQ